MVATRSSGALAGALCTLAGGVLWGFSGTCAQLLTSVYDVPAVFITWTRMLCTGLIVLAYMLVAQRSKVASMLTDRSTVRGLLLYSVVGLFVVQTSYALATKYTSAGMATVIQSFSTVFLIAWACASCRKAPNRVEVVATAMALAAVFLMATGGDVGSLAIPLVALFWGLVDAASTAFFAQYPTRLLDRWGALPVLGMGMLFGGLYGLPVAHPWDVTVAWDALSIGALVAMILLGTFGAFVLFLEGVRRVGAVRATLLGLSEPVSASLFSWALLGTALTAVDMVGFALMLGMVVMVTLAKPKERARAINEAQSEKAQEVASGPSAGELAASAATPAAAPAATAATAASVVPMHHARAHAVAKRVRAFGHPRLHRRRKAA